MCAEDITLLTVQTTPRWDYCHLGAVRLKTPQTAVLWAHSGVCAAQTGCPRHLCHGAACATALVHGGTAAEHLHLLCTFTQVPKASAGSTLVPPPQDSAIHFRSFYSRRQVCTSILKAPSKVIFDLHTFIKNVKLMITPTLLNGAC